MPTTMTVTRSDPSTLPGRDVPTALVVHESCWGNTRLVAEAIAQGLGEGATVVGVASAPPLDQVHTDLLVVGAPTHAFGLSRPGTRHDASERGGTDPGTGIREWLEAASPAAGRRAATFDTHVRRPNLPGTASRAAARRLRHLGFEIVREPEVFWVRGMEGPLEEGELARARAWGAELVRLL
ncbi:flavodoxin family protein [Ornithinimicrobium humiphilum]|uniref:Flavodoxin n=1 Tax=Ornithinimicrobium humiphilum TaxID=125288 RepID=A0A543KNR7_9MICO|nr:flavodoxin domain-containing protein [Ornithinimicrobium humiphilum]TQM96712.1 flavodoxin [Ornithinimicrobium humiphilum]